MSLRKPSASRVAWLLAAAIGAAVLLAAQLPYARGWRSNRWDPTGPKVFTGALPTSAVDTTTYWSWIAQARDGHVRFADYYTPEETPRDYTNVLFWALGVVARVGGWSVPGVYAAARPILGVLVLVLLWQLVGIVFPKPWERLACFLFAVLSGGWEGIACYLERNHGGAHVSSPAWWTPEMSTLFSAMIFPHFLAGFALMIGTAILLLRAWTVPTSWLHHAVAAGAALTLLTFVHPYDAITMLGVAWSAPFLMALADRRFPRREGLATLVATAMWFPSLAYNWLVFRTNPAMRAWDLQNLMDTPEPARLFIAFGVAGILSCAALFGWKRMSRPQLVMAAWFVSTIVLIELPLRFQRRMIGGIQFPMAALSVFTLSTFVVPAIARALRRPSLISAMGGSVLVAALALAPLQSFTPYYIVDIERRGVRHAKFPSWILRTEADALRFLRDETPEDARVMASEEMGNYVPALSLRHCVLGHYGLTIDATGKRAEVAKFFATGEADDVWRRELMARYGARWLLWTAHERALGGFDPASSSWLREVFRAGDGDARAIVYEVTTEGTGR